MIKLLEGICSLRRKSVHILPSSRRHCPVPTGLIGGLYTCVSEILTVIIFWQGGGLRGGGQSIPIAAILDSKSKRRLGRVESAPLPDWEPICNWWTEWLVDRLIDWLTGSLTHWIAGWLAGRLTHWLASWLTDYLTHWLAGWGADWLTDCLTDWLTDWLTDCLTDSLTVPEGL